MTTKLHLLNRLGQSIWYDNIRRSLIDSGELQDLLDAGVTGVTSNPSIFEKAIAGSADYDEAIKAMSGSSLTSEAIFETLALEDIQRTADLLRPVYDATDGVDGYVSREVSPVLAHDTAGPVAAARRLFAALDRPNVMIKVPATAAGIPAIETLISEGINVNVTLLFSLAHYESVAGAYLVGLEKLAQNGGNVQRVASVASFFISRVDSAVDRLLAGQQNTELQGQIGIANAKAAYARFREIFTGERWDRLAAQGGRVQRPLWASTGTKNPHYPDTLYLDNLIGPDTVNTVPPATLSAFRDHGTVAVTLDQCPDEARDQLARLAELGIDLDHVTRTLQAEGVAAFGKSYELLIRSVTEKRHKLQAGEMEFEAELGVYQELVDSAMGDIREDAIMQRIWGRDHTVWKDDPTEIANRLGWLNIAERMLDDVNRLQALADEARADGYTHALLLGMGGSSLAPDVFRRIFGARAGYIDLAVLDSTDPDTIIAAESRLPLDKTLFIVSTKSGGTPETLSLFKYFYNRVAAELGAARTGEHFIAITDPGSKLVTLAAQHGFRATFLNDPNIGGRYSALSYFGLVPAALMGVDVVTLLERALVAGCNCESCNCSPDGNNYGAYLGAIMGELARAGRDKMTFIFSPDIAAFGDWVEQLIAESTGKEGRGILPVVTEPVGVPGVYGADRLFVYLRLRGDDSYDGAARSLADAGHPLVTIHLDDGYDLGGQFFLWEMATAVAGYRLGINPFDQPNVEAAKVLAREMIDAFQKKGVLPESPGTPLSLETLHAFLAGSRSGDYVAIQAYIQPTDETYRLLQAMAAQIRERYCLATTIGYGPRFLHSTGQLHKGDGGNGLFIQLTSDAGRRLPIPDETGRDESGISFGILKLAQAAGDAEALRNAKRRVIRFPLGSDANKNLARLIEA